MEYIIASVKHTRREHKYITLWDFNCSGYVLSVDAAGSYSHREVRARPEYFFNRTSTYPVSVDLANKIKNREGFLENNERVWNLIKEDKALLLFAG